MKKGENTAEVWAAAASVIGEIMAERTRQVEKGYGAAHDDEHQDGELARAAASCAVGGGGEGAAGSVLCSVLWPFREQQAARTRREDLIVGAAFLVAEIERIDRAAARAVREAST